MLRAISASRGLDLCQSCEALEDAVDPFPHQPSVADGQSSLGSLLKAFEHAASRRCAFVPAGAKRREGGPAHPRAPAPASITSDTALIRPPSLIDMAEISETPGWRTGVLFVLFAVIIVSCVGRAHVRVP